MLIALVSDPPLDGAAKLVEAAGKGNLAFASFLVLVLAAIAWKFFGKDAQWLRIGAFLVIIACIVFFIFVLAVPPVNKAAANVAQNAAEPARLHIAQYSLDSPISWQTSGSYALNLTPEADSPRADVSGAFFTGPVAGKYTVEIKARGNPCPSCYSFMTVFYKASTLDQLNKKDNPALGSASSRIAATVNSYNTKDPVFDFDPQPVWLEKGESLWLRGSPCGDTHCMGPVSATLNTATATVTWNQ